MGTVIFDMSMSLDGFIAGPKDDSNPDRELGALDILHDWMFPPKGNFQEIASERFKNVGAVVMGRRMFDPGEEPWGDNPVFHAPVFVLSHRSKEKLVNVPVLLGEGIRLFEKIGTEQIKLEKISVTEAPGVTHLRFRVVK